MHRLLRGTEACMSLANWTLLHVPLPRQMCQLLRGTDAFMSPSNCCVPVQTIRCQLLRGTDTCMSLTNCMLHFIAWVPTARQRCHLARVVMRVLHKSWCSNACLSIVIHITGLPAAGWKFWKFYGPAMMKLLDLDTIWYLEHWFWDPKSSKFSPAAQIS